MARIKKRGLDYFPLNTDFIHDRVVRRIMKREGDGAFSILIGTLSCIYAGEGYFVRADDLFYEDLSACLYQQSAADVRRILSLAVEYGIFDAGLFDRYGILTSAEIQEQYLFSTKRRKGAAIAEEYRLAVPAEETEETEETETADDGTEADRAAKTDRTKNAEQSARTSQNVTLTPQNATSGTHSIAQHSIAKNSKKYPLLNSSPETGGTHDAGSGEPAGRKEEISLRQEEGIPPQQTWGIPQAGAIPQAGGTPPDKAGTAAPRKEWTAADIDRLQPPADGVKRNLDGLKYNLRQFGIPLGEQYAIILKSNFGAIGHPMWRGFETLRTSHGKIRLPGRYLLSLCWNR